MKFELNDYHRNTSDNDLIADLKKVAGELKKDSITVNEYKKLGKYNASTISKRFGSWNESLEMASLKITLRQNIPEEELFKNLEDVWIKLGRQPTYAEIQLPLSQFPSSVYANRFGSWHKALKKFVEYIKNDPEAEVNEAKTTSMEEKN